ncbi:carboxylesterase/lipase family protein [SAR92 clade bacterium H246]
MTANVNNYIEVATPQGRLIGQRSTVVSGSVESNDLGPQPAQVGVFKGIPYALPPVGAYRWQPAQPAATWHGARWAIDYAPAAPQLGATDDDFFFYNPGFQTSEDCLYLNVWAPCDGLSREDHSACKQYPVMLWLHGGGLLVGAGTEPCYEATELARKGAVVVTINYRLGIFGYFSHPGLSQESPNNASGNYGTTDQIQALKWVQKNISAFGGDPRNVTVFGESAGASSIAHLLASPLAKNYFHKAILQSAYLPPIPYLRKPCFGMPSAEEYGQNFAESIGIEKTTQSEQAVQRLRDMPAHQLLEVSSTFEFDKPVIDGYVQMQQLFETFEQGAQHNVPLIAGFNSNEGSYFPLVGLIKAPSDKASYETMIQDKYGDIAEDYLTIYPPDDLYKSSYEAMGHGLYGWGTETIARLTSQSGVSVYFYCFDHVPEWAARKGLGAVHALDIIYTFNNVKHNRKVAYSWPDANPDTADISMAELISDYWLAFAQNGDPNDTHRAHWQPYTAEKKSYLRFSNGSAEPSSDLLSAELKLHDRNVKMRQALNQSWSYKDLGLRAASVAK